jgi:hypothetical protein
MFTETTGANTQMCSVYDDVELHDWLRWAEENGPSFLRTIAEAAFAADLKNYNLIRPARPVEAERGHSQGLAWACAPLG